MILFWLSYVLMSLSALGSLYLLWLTWRAPHLGGLRWVFAVIAFRSPIGVMFNLLEAPVELRVFIGHLTISLAVWGMIVWLHRQH